MALDKKCVAAEVQRPLCLGGRWFADAGDCWLLQAAALVLCELFDFYRELR